MMMMMTDDDDDDDDDDDSARGEASLERSHSIASQPATS